MLEFSKQTTFLRARRFPLLFVQTIEAAHIGMTKKSQRRYTLHSLLLFLVLGSFFSGMVFADTFDLARQNPTLRNFFLQQQLRSSSYTDYYGRIYYVGNMRFLEQYVDRLVDDFLAQVIKKLGTLEGHFNQVQQARDEILAGAFNDKGRHEAQARWKHSLKGVADQAESLRKMISYVLIDLDNKSNFTPVIRGDSNRSLYQDEIRFIEEQMIKAERRIKDFFFLPTHAIHVDDLKGENMMIYLYRVRKMAEVLSKQ
ncbi:hypothetical protein MYX82_00540 [Acidobacteria bacterium AH-259-D05]|nr:hypothetical protein [Acidobacteria bacterium AH-259-D05]